MHFHAMPQSAGLSPKTDGELPVVSCCWRSGAKRELAFSLKNQPKPNQTTRTKRNEPAQVRGEMDKAVPSRAGLTLLPLPTHLQTLRRLNVCFSVTKVCQSHYVQHDGLTLYNPGNWNRVAAVKSHRLFHQPGSPVEGPCSQVLSCSETPGHGTPAGFLLHRQPHCNIHRKKSLIVKGQQPSRRLES